MDHVDCRFAGSALLIFSAVFIIKEIDLELFFRVPHAHDYVFLYAFPGHFMRAVEKHLPDSEKDPFFFFSLSIC